MSLNPSTYTRDDRASPFLYVRYAGTCPSCDSHVQATPRQKQSQKHDAEWVRCRDCGQITLCPQSATANYPEEFDE